MLRQTVPEIAASIYVARSAFFGGVPFLSSGIFCLEQQFARYFFARRTPRQTARQISYNATSPERFKYKAFER